MVIGMDIGTTVTAALATIGGNTAVRRTGLAHVIYNLLTAIVAFALLGPYVWALNSIAPSIVGNEPELSLVGFHTFFNGLGVILVLPFAGHFARLIVRLFPEDVSSLVRHLSKSLRKDEFLALEAVRNTLLAVSCRLFEGLTPLLIEAKQEPLQEMLEEVKSAISSVDSYLAKVHTTKELGLTNDAHLGVLHALDHLKMMVVLCTKVAPGVRHPETQKLREAAAHALTLVSAKLPQDSDASPAEPDPFALLDSSAEHARRRILNRATTGAHSLDETEAILEGIRWIAAIGQHARRIHHHVLAFPIAGTSSTSKAD
jgi:phosphate:Na+ symporter